MIPIAVIAHPKREKLANKLAQQVNADTVCWDAGKIGASRNHIQAWQWFSSDTNADYGCIIEDDILPCAHFRQNLEKAVKNSPAPILSLYLGRDRPPHRQQDIARVIAAPVSYYTDTDLLSCQGYVIRADLFEMWEQIQSRVHLLPIDEAISHWAKTMGVPIAYTRFSLVDHRDGPTLIADHGDGEGRNGKTSVWTPDCDPSGKDLPAVRKAWLVATTTTDWTQGVMELPIDGKRCGLRRPV